VRKRVPSILKQASRRASSHWADATGWNALVPAHSGTLAGVAITPESALGLAAVYAAINVIATDLACLPLEVYRKRRDGGRDYAGDHPVASMFASSPDGETTSMRWRQAILGHVLGWGNGYAEIEFSAGRPVGAYLLDPMTEPMRRPQDRVLYYAKPDGNTLPPRRAIHLAGLGFDGLKGYSPVRLARETLGLTMAAERFGSSFFGNGSRPSGILKLPAAMRKETKDRVRDEWERMQSGSNNTGRTAVLDAGSEWQSITIPPEDAQFLATRQFQVIEVARLYRVPPHKIGDYSQSHLANIEAANLDYLTTTLMPWCEAIEQELNLKLFTPEERVAGFYVEHNMAAFLRGDMKSRAEFYTKLRDLGVFTPNDVAERENLNPIGDEGDIRLVPVNMQTLERAGMAPEPAPAPGAPAPAVEPDDDEEDDMEEPGDGPEDGGEEDDAPEGGNRLARYLGGSRNGHR
jgi:HK97 family phage portal protein